jgi:hypothetical protein
MKTTHPEEIENLGDFATALQDVRDAAGGPTLRWLEQWGRNHGKPLPRTTVADMLRGQRLPRVAILTAFLEACDVPNELIKEWALAWGRLLPSRSVPPEAPHEAAKPHPNKTPSWLQDAQAVIDLMRGGWEWKEPARWRSSSPMQASESANYPGEATKAEDKPLAPPNV